MKAYRRDEIVTGIFVVVSLAMMIWGVSQTQTFRSAGGDTTAYTIRLKSSGHLTEGTMVAYAEIPVGRIQSVRLLREEEGASNKLPVELTIQLRSNVPVRRSTRAIIASEGMLGEPFLNLLPGDANAPLLSSGSEIPGAPAPLAEAMETLPEIANGINELVQKMNNLVGDEQSPGAIQEIVAEVKHVTGSATHAMDNANSLVQDVRDLLTQNRGTIDGALSSLKDRIDDLQSLGQLIEENREPLRNLIGDLGAGLPQTVEVLNKDLDKLNQVLSGLDTILVNNEANIYASLRNVRTATRELAETMEKVRSNPSVVLWGDKEDVARERPTNEVHVELRDSGRIGPYGKR